MGIRVSAKMVCCRLLDNRYLALSPCNKLKLTAKMIVKHQLWANQHKNWTKNDWNNVHFSDESSFHVSENKMALVL